MTDGALGNPVIGPAGLMEVPETQLGLTVPALAILSGIATYAFESTLRTCNPTKKVSLPHLFQKTRGLHLGCF
jgi:hypothetical protein